MSARKGKPVPVAELLRRRLALLIRLAKLDGALAAQGVRPAEHPRGSGRRVALLTMAALQAGPRRARDVARTMRRGVEATGQVLARLARGGAVVRVSRGLYARPGAEADPRQRKLPW